MSATAGLATRLDQFDRWLTARRSSVAGEAGWVLLIAGAVTLQVAALVPAFARPDLIDLAAFIDNARAWLAGTPYPAASRDPNAPHTILVFVPMVYLPLRMALAVWLTVSYGTAVLALRLAARELGLRPTPQTWATVAAVVAVAPPSLDVVTNGNMIWPLALLATAAWALDRRGRSGGAGVLLGVLASIKPFVGLWFVYLALRRDWRAVGAFVLGCAGALAAGVAVAGAPAWEAWFLMLQRIDWYDVRFNASVLGLVSRSGVSSVVWWPVSVAIVLVSARAVSKRPGSRDRQWLVMLTAAMLVSPLGWRYYSWLGVGPLAAVLLAGRLRSWQQAAIVIWIWALAFEAPDGLAGATLGSMPFWGLLLGWSALSTGPPAARGVEGRPG